MESRDGTGKKSSMEKTNMYKNKIYAFTQRERQMRR